MDENQLKNIASLLACPVGEEGNSMGDKMNDTNAFITGRSIERLAPEAGEGIVEIGPGNGVLSIPVLQSVGADGFYIGIELSEAMARQTRETLGKFGADRFKILAKNCMDAPIDERSVDGVFAVNVLYFIDDIFAFFATIARCLKPVGRVVLGVRSPASLNSMPFTRFGFCIRSLDEITEQLTAAGFKEIDSEYFDEGKSKLGDLEIPVDSLIISATAG